MSDSSVDEVRAKFPKNTSFVFWKYAAREINILKDFLALCSLIGCLSKHRTAIVHLHSSKAGFLGRIACWILGIKRVIYTPHCGAFLRTDISEKKKNIYSFLEKLAGKFGGLVVGCGESECVLYQNLGLRAVFVNNGVEYKEPKNIVKEKLVVFAGLANEQKNPILFNKIAKGIKSKIDIQCIWIGDGPLRNVFDSDSVFVTGWLTADEVQAYLDKSLIYLSTSNWEGLPFGVLEAMNAGCALLLHDVPGNHELVYEGRNGYLFTDAQDGINKLLSLLSNTDKTINMGKESNSIIKEKYTNVQMGEKYREIYLSLL
jgi:glycosyltransferase involved in cell wall biosynthesis